MRTLLMISAFLVIGGLVLWALFGIRKPLVQAEKKTGEPSKFREEYAADHSPETGMKHLENEELKRKNQ